MCVFFLGKFVRQFFPLALSLWQPLWIANVRASGIREPKQKRTHFPISFFSCVNFLFGVRSLVQMTEWSDVCLFDYFLFGSFSFFVFSCLHHQFSVHANSEAEQKNNNIAHINI